MIYFDNAATTQPDQSVLDTYIKVNESFWANPHSLHRIGERAEQLLEQSRSQIISLLADDNYKAIFTSGASESNNLALKGIAELYQKRGKHIITTNVEHPSVAETVNYLEDVGYEITRLPVDKDGIVTVEQVKKALRDDTIIVSVMFVNNESGAINPIKEIGNLLKEKKTLFHVDAVQAIGKIPFTMDTYFIDMLSLSAHKFFGLKGSGVLILPKRQELIPLIHGGGQEGNLRSGTGDVARAASTAKALRLSLEEIDRKTEKITKLNHHLRENIVKIDGVTINSSSYASPYILNCSVDGVKPETILHSLAKRNIYISTVSACSSKKSEPSKVILAMTDDIDRASKTIRLSLSHKTTKGEIDQFITIFREVLEELR